MHQVIFVNRSDLSNRGERNVATYAILCVSIIVDVRAVICTETWTLEHAVLFNIPGYKLRYNEGNINRADGVYCILEKIS